MNDDPHLILDLRTIKSGRTSETYFFLLSDNNISYDSSKNVKASKSSHIVTSTLPMIHDLLNEEIKLFCKEAASVNMTTIFLSPKNRLKTKLESKNCKTEPM